MLDHLSPSTGITSEELSELVAYDFGSFGERFFLRCLARLVEEGLARKGVDWFVKVGQDETPVYFRVHDARWPDSEVDDRQVRMRIARGVRPSWWNWTMYLALAIKHRPRCQVALPGIPVGPWPGYRVLQVGALRRWDIAPRLSGGDPAGTKR